MSETLREIIYRPTESNVDTINTLLEEEITTEQEVAEAVIDSGNVKGMYLVCKYVHISARTIGRITHQVCKSGNALYIYYLARDVISAPIEELMRGIIATHNLKYIYEFAKDVNRSDKEKLGQVIIGYKDPYYILKFALSVKGCLESSIESALVEIGNTLYIYQYATHVPNSNKEKLAQGMINAEDSSEIFYFLRDFRNNLKDEIIIKLVKRIIDLKTSQWIYLTSTLSLPFTEEFSVDTLADGLINANYDELYYGLNIALFARDYAKRGAPIERLVNTLIKTNSFDNIVKLIVDVPEIDACVLIDFLMDSVKSNTLDLDKLLQYLVNLSLQNQYYSDYAVEKIVAIGDTKVMNSLIVALKDDNIKLVRVLSQATLEIEMAVDKNNNLAV